MMNPDLARLVIAYRRGEISYEEYMKGVAGLEAAQSAPQEPVGYQSPSAPAPEGAFNQTPTREEYRPNALGQPYYGMDELSAGSSYQPVMEDRLTRAMPMPASSAPVPRAVSTARQTLPAAPQQQPSATPEERTGMLTRLVRGDFREGADQRVMEAMRRQREESGMAEGRASGGQVESKKASRDDVLNKALDIIHTMLTRR
jgi:hypothetical protein